MPYSVHIDESLSLVIGRLYGLVDDSTLFGYFDELERRGPFRNGFNLLLVIEVGAKLTAETEAIRYSASRPSTFDGEALRVILASDELGFGLSRVYVSHAPKASGQYRLVRNSKEAAELLAIESATLDSLLKSILE